MNWNMFGGPQQQGLRMPNRMPMGYTMPQQGLQMPGSMAPGPAAAQQGLQVPAGLATQMNAPLQPNLSKGMNPMAMMQLMNMGMKMAEQKPQVELPPAFRAPIMDVQPFRPLRRSLFSR